MSLPTQNQGPVPTTASETHSNPINESFSQEALSSQALNILVFGPTGTGKSTIINHLTNSSANLPIGHDLESCTTDITPASIQHKGRKIMFFDTPGFDDSEKTPAEHLVLLMGRLDELYEIFEGRPHIHGVFYIHRITDNKMSKSAKMNIRKVEALLGDHVLKNLVFVTNMWGTPPKDNHVRFEQSLIQKTEYFGAAIKKGARAGPAYRICEGATRTQVQETLLDIFLDSDPEVLQAQREMSVSNAVEISSTEAGQVVREELRATESGLQEKLGDLEKQLEDVPVAEEDKREEISADIENVKANLYRLQRQDILLDANTTFLRQCIPKVLEQAYIAAFLSALNTAVLGAVTSEATIVVAGAAVAAAGVAGVAVLGIGILARYAWWRRNNNSQMPNTSAESS